MGLSNAMSGGIILFGITYVIFSFGGLTNTAVTLSDASSQIANLENKWLKTSIEITIDNPPGADATFDFEIINTDLEKLWDFDDFDVIITYDNSDTTYTETLTYNSACPPVAGEWCINSWTDDIMDPEILNNGETITIRAEVNNSLQSNSDLIIIVSTQNGIVASVTTIV